MDSPESHLHTTTCAGVRGGLELPPALFSETVLSHKYSDLQPSFTAGHDYFPDGH